MPNVRTDINNLIKEISMSKEELCSNYDLFDEKIDEFIKSIPKKEMIEVSSGEYDKDKSLYLHEIKSKTKNNRATTIGFLYEEVTLPFHIQVKINNHNDIILKQVAKVKAKESVSNKYKIGDILVLRGKIRDGSRRIVKVFEVKKIIWSVKSQIVNVLVLKQLEGPNNNRTLTKDDCKKYHIKYEPGLQVYSMNIGFSKRKKYINNELN